MGREEELAQAYDAARPRLIRVAYSVLGTYSDAEDAVSDTWLKLVGADRRDRVLDVEAWATVAVARAALDTLRSTRMRRETYVGPWLPEPIVERLPSESNPADRVTLDDSVSYALLVVLESLTPAERTAFVLHDLFAMPFQDVASVVGRTPAAVRQLASRARGHVQASTPRLKVDADEHKRTVSAFLAAAAGGDLNGLVSLLDHDVVATSDGGGQVSAARRPVQGAEKVARFILGLLARYVPDRRADLVMVNGVLGIARYDGDHLDFVVSFGTGGGRIETIDIVRAPEKLEHAAAGDHLS
ncbi:RNA polymerase sigma factor SigJ [Actinoplanes sp. TBRC 11911]|uniref:RNA polymerase sigma factor SigJ n=1 Tax=Actinoplanes sp. TBRC 11911 TaxID=2729386 RepID=UPI001B7D58D7|nr:RNA polymerase sigma factor SigJ [Actinoplanes sp. TBRC 11911]